MSELHDSVDCSNLKFEYVGSTKDKVFMSIWILKNFLMQWKIIKLNLVR